MTRRSALLALALVLTAATAISRSNLPPSLPPHSSLSASTSTATPGPAAPDPVLIACSVAAASVAAAAHAADEPAPVPNLLGSILLPGHDTPIDRWKAFKYFCIADFNRDDAVDDRDLSEFLDAWSSRAGPYAEFLDINRDGRLNAEDFESFLESFTANDCDPKEASDYRSIIC